MRGDRDGDWVSIWSYHYHCNYFECPLFSTKEVDNWVRRPDEEIRQSTSTLYNSYRESVREEIEDLEDLPVLDADGLEINIYDEDRYRVP